MTKYDSSGYHSESWWYWSKGKEFTFTWGEYIEGCCDKSTYTFTPIYKITTSMKKEIEKTKKLESIETTEKCDCILSP